MVFLKLANQVFCNPPTCKTEPANSAIETNGLGTIILFKADCLPLYTRIEDGMFIKRTFFIKLLEKKRFKRIYLIENIIYFEDLGGVWEDGNRLLL